MKKIGLNMGHVTNSSSMVYWFPREVLEDSEIKAFIEAFELGKGWVGRDLGSRSGCASFVVSQEQRIQANKRFHADGYDSSPRLSVENDDLVLIYGDEYQTTAHTLCNLLVEACNRNNLRYDRMDMH